MNKLERRAEMQEKYCWPHPRALPPSAVRNITINISDYSRQETILEWMGYNSKIFNKITPSVWSELLDYVEDNPDIPTEEILDNFKNGYPILQAHHDSIFRGGIHLLGLISYYQSSVFKARNEE